MQQIVVTDHVRMKRNLRKIDTYGISPKILKRHRKTIFWVSEVGKPVGGEGVLRIYPTCYVYDKKTKKYIQTEIEFYKAYLNPEMFVKVEDFEYESESSKKGFIKRFAQ